MQLSLDVPLIENYAEDLASRSSPGSVENTARTFPMFWTAFVNCPWSESANQLGLSETDYKGGCETPVCEFLLLFVTLLDIPCGGELG